MSDNHRKHPRKEVHIDVRLAFQDSGVHLVRTRDISEGGMFLELDLDNPSAYPLGELVHVQYKDPVKNDLYTQIDAVIVRVSSEGLAIAFVDLDAF